MTVDVHQAELVAEINNITGEVLRLYVRNTFKHLICDVAAAFQPGLDIREKSAIMCGIPDNTQQG